MMWRERHLSGLGDFGTHSLLPSPSHPECVSVRSLGPVPHSLRWRVARSGAGWQQRCSNASFTEPLRWWAASGESKIGPASPAWSQARSWAAPRLPTTLAQRSRPPQPSLPCLAAVHVAAHGGSLTPVWKPWPPGWLLQSTRLPEQTRAERPPCSPGR